MVKCPDENKPTRAPFFRKSGAEKEFSSGQGTKW